MPLPPLLTRIRGIRSPIPAGYVVGRAVGSKSGQLIPISQLANGPGGVAGGGVPPGGSVGPPTPPTLSSGDVLGNATASPATAVDTSLTALLDRAFGSAEGDILQRGASAWGVLAPGTAHQVLQSGGASALNSWAGLSALLDAVFGSTEGEILQRGASLWQVLATGTAGQVLTSGGAAALNTWGAGFKLTNQGAWVGTIAYNPGDVVQFDGSSYLNFAAVTAPTGSPTTWNPADKGSNITLSAGNLTATGGAAAAAVRSVLSETSGKFYAEITETNAANNFTGFGFANATAPVSSVPNTNNIAVGFNIGSIFVNGSSLGSWAGSPVTHGGFAIDLGAQLAWWCADVTASPQSWNGSTSNSPGGSGGISTAGLGAVGTAIFLYAAIQAGIEAFTLITSPGSYAHAAPAGFGPWTTAASNTSPDQDDAHWLSQGNVSTVDSNFTITSGGQLQHHTIASGNVLGVSGGSTAEPTSATMTAMLDRAFGSTEGQILQRGASAWQILAPGISGQVLKSGGASALNSWGFPTPQPGPSSQTGGNFNTTSLTPVMAGNQALFTPSRTGICLAIYTATVGSTSATSQMTVQMVFGTGAAPTAGASPTGSSAGPSSSPAYASAGLTLQGVLTIAAISALTPGTAYWFDVQVNAVNATDHAFASNQFFQILEF